MTCNRFQESLFTLKHILLDENKTCINEQKSDGSIGNKRTREQILQRIETCIYEVTKDIANDVPPTFVYSRTSAWADVRFTENTGLQLKDKQNVTSVRFESSTSVRKFSLMVKVLSIIYRLVKTGQYCTKRDIYYQDTGLFSNQHTLDVIVDNISCMLEVPRWDLHILATSKGCIAGDLVFQDADENLIDCRNTTMGVQVPTHVCGMHKVRTNALFVLVVEKDATFQKLLQDRICDKMHPCILVTGKGFPDINTRMLLKKLWENFHIPILALMDADPHGVEIMAVYKFGSKALSYETGHLAVPSLRWLGLLPSDIERLGVPKTALIPLTSADTDKGRELLSRPYMEHFPHWKKEVEAILQMNCKAEIQSLDSVSPCFLCDVYLPSKIRCSSWL